jgi:hypothetical protein
VLGRCRGEGAVSGGDAFRLGWQRAGLIDVGDFQGDRPEHVDAEQVGRPGGTDGVKPGVGEEFEEPFVEGEGVRAVDGPPIIRGTAPGCASSAAQSP